MRLVAMAAPSAAAVAAFMASLPFAMAGAALALGGGEGRKLLFNAFRGAFRAFLGRVGKIFREVLEKISAFFALIFVDGHKY